MILNKIRVLIVDDSMLFRKVLIDNLSKKPNIEIIGSAIDAFDAEKKILQLKPDVVTCDVEMPRMNGIDYEYGCGGSGPCSAGALFLRNGGRCLYAGVRYGDQP